MARRRDNGPARTGPASVCLLIEALKKGGRKLALMAYTGQCEATVAEWVKQFRAHGFVRVVAWEKDARGHMQVPVYRWVEAGDPITDAEPVRVSPAERAKNWRARKRGVVPIKTSFAGGVPIWRAPLAQQCRDK